MQKITKIKEIKKNWYNSIIKKPLKGSENSNIQYIIEYQGNYSVVSLKPITLEEIENINLKDWNFQTWKEVKIAGVVNDNN